MSSAAAEEIKNPAHDAGFFFRLHAAPQISGRFWAHPEVGDGLSN